MNVPKYKYLTYWLSYFFFLLVLTSSVQAQSGRASYQDSLIRLLQNTADPIRKAGIFSVLAKYSYENKKYETSIGYANDAIALQNNQTPKLVIAHAYIYAGLSFDALNRSNEAFSKLKKALEFEDEHLADITRVTVHLTLTNLYRIKNDIRSSLNHAKIVLDLREKAINLPATRQKLISTYQYVGDMHQLLGEYNQAIYYWQKVLNSKLANHDTPVTYLFQNISLAYSLMGKHDSGLYFTKKLQELAKSESSDTTKIKSYLSEARALENLARFNEAEVIFKEAINFSKVSGNRNFEALLLNNLAGLKVKQSKYPEAAELFFQSLSISESINNRELIASNLNDLASVYKSSRDYEKACTSLEKAIVEFEKLGMTDRVYVAKNNLAVIKLLRGETKTANSILDSLKNVKNWDSVKAMGQQAFLQLSNGAYDETFSITTSALNAALKIKDDIEVSRNLLILGKLYLEMAKDSSLSKRPDSLKFTSKDELLKSSERNLLNSLHYLSIFRNPDLLMENWHILSELYEMKHIPDLSLKYYKNYIDLRDSIINLDNEKVILEADAKYQYDKKLAIQKERQRASGRLWISIGISVLILSLLSFFLIRTIEKKKHQLELTSLKQEALNAQISDHFISNTMDSIYHFIQQNKKEEAGEYLLIFSRLIRRVLENATARLVPLSDDLDILKDYIALEKLRFINQDLQYTIQVDESINTQQTMIPPMIFQVLAENAIKHGLQKKKSGHIQFYILQKGNNIECRVEDNGVGREVTYKLKSDANRKSFGSQLAQKLVLTAHKVKRQARFEVMDLFDNNNLPSGTAVTFTLPLIVMD